MIWKFGKESNASRIATKTFLF